MPRWPLSDTLLGWVRRRFASGHSNLAARRGPRDHVIILDGTMSSLEPGNETNAGRAYRLITEAGDASVYYEAGVQWPDWRSTMDVMMGRGINRQIRRAYGFLASRYRPGDRIFLLGYSRGAYAVRSLAGVIDRVGLLRADQATVRNVRQAYRLYQFAPSGEAARAFAKAHCHEVAPIEMVGVWDTVKALGLRLPFLWRFTERQHAFHDASLGASIDHGYQALAWDETRLAFSPVLWEVPGGGEGRVEQVWFRGTHGDIGGQLNGFEAARGLANIPLVWMLERAQSHGLALPEGWHARLQCDAGAPSVGGWQGFGKLFLLRGPRRRLHDGSERLHDSLAELSPDVAIVPA